MDYNKENNFFKQSATIRGYPYYGIPSPIILADDEGNHKISPIKNTDANTQSWKNNENELLIQAPPNQNENGDISVVITVPDIETNNGKIKGNYKFRFLLDDLGKDFSEPIEVQLNLEELKHSAVGTNTTFDDHKNDITGKSTATPQNLIPLSKISQTKELEKDLPKNPESCATNHEPVVKEIDHKCCLLNRAIENVKSMANLMRLNKSEYIKERPAFDEDNSQDFKNLLSRQLNPLPNSDNLIQFEKNSFKAESNSSDAQMLYRNIRNKSKSVFDNEDSDSHTIPENYLHLKDFIGDHCNDEIKFSCPDLPSKSKANLLSNAVKQSENVTKFDPNIMDHYKILSSQINCNKNCPNNLNSKFKQSRDLGDIFKISNQTPSLSYLKHMSSEYKKRIMRMKAMQERKQRCFMTSRATSCSRNYNKIDHSLNNSSYDVSTPLTFSSKFNLNMYEKSLINQSNRGDHISSIEELLNISIDQVQPYLSDVYKNVKLDLSSSVTIEQIIQDYLTRENSKKILMSSIENNKINAFLKSQECQTEQNSDNYRPLIGPPNQPIFGEDDDNFLLKNPLFSNKSNSPLSEDAVSDNSDCWIFSDIPNRNDESPNSIQWREKELKLGSRESLKGPCTHSNQNFHFSISSFRPTSNTFDSEDETVLNNKDITFGTPQSIRLIDKPDALETKSIKDKLTNSNDSSDSDKSSSFNKTNYKSQFGSSFIQKELLDIISALNQSPEFKRIQNLTKYNYDIKGEGKFIHQFTNIELPATKGHMRLFRHSSSGSLKSWRIRQLESIFSLEFQTSSIILKDGKKLIRVGIAYYVKSKS